MNRALAARGRSRRGWTIFAPLVFFLVIVAAYTAYWAYARAELDKGIDAWIASERGRGMTVEYDDKTLGGYPFRFALTVTAPRYGNPRTGQRWEGETLQLVMQPWNWQHIIARSPGENRIFERGLEGWARLGPKSAGSLSWTDAGITRLSIALDTAAFDLAGELGGEVDAFEFHLRPYPETPTTLQLETHWQALRLDDTIPQADALGPNFGPSIVRAEASQGVPALAVSPEPSSLPATVLRLGGDLSVPQAMLRWGALDLGARATLRRDDTGALRGSVGIRLENADDLRTALANESALDDETARSIDALEAASADGRFLELSVRDDGLYLLGNRVLPLDVTEIVG